MPSLVSNVENAGLRTHNTTSRNRPRLRSFRAQIIAHTSITNALTRAVQWALLEFATLACSEAADPAGCAIGTHALGSAASSNSSFATAALANFLKTGSGCRLAAFFKAAASMSPNFLPTPWPQEIRRLARLLLSKVATFLGICYCSLHQKSFGVSKRVCALLRFPLSLSRQRQCLAIWIKRAEIASGISLVI